jgi:hypothetical protein
MLYIAEAYQCYHGASIGLALTEHAGVEVVNFYNDPETPKHLERIRAAMSGPRIPQQRLRRSLRTRLVQSVHVLGYFKKWLLRDNAATLNGYDAIFAVENSVYAARDFGIVHPKLIYSPHGFGDRARGFRQPISVFDFVLVAGTKTEARMLNEGLIRPDHYALTGSVKMEVAAQLRVGQAPLFSTARPVVLYNAHKEHRLNSWKRFIEPMLADFKAQDIFNLIVAPHVKMYHRYPAAVRAAWAARSTANILIDTDSERSMDMTYTSAADIYVGDISSQVYEFLAVPRPCVFLNANRVAWQNDPNYRHWQLGDVIDDPAELMPAIQAARSRHALYRARQEELVRDSLGDISPGSATRAANAILSFLGR